MKKFFLKYILTIMTVLGICVAIYTFLNWTIIADTQRIVGLLFFAITLHEWEELKFPGGFVEMATSRLKLPGMDMGVPKILLALLTLYLAFLPIFFPKIVWMAAAPLMLGVIEVFAHLAATRMNPEKRFYSPGLVTSLLVILPVTVWGIYSILKSGAMSPLHWLFAFLYLVIPLVLTQRYIVKMSGMKYSDFLRNARSAMFGNAGKL